ncbi:chromosome segregation SMC family protein [Paracoccaceae bacterium GXU_MW_L88]
MQFTKLRLYGFKSFVDPTDLLIETGLTGVVGPNGCGKSNLLEALRWAMGETRAKAMRGAGMEDVIFAGTSGRNARSYAEVVLTLDNQDRLAPAMFNDEDRLDITRRITRDAGSAYKVNGKDVRARDVQMLFADASTGAHSPALVRQGQIAELINAKPKARRRILEEAAGISGLYQRRHEAELKLNAALNNLERVQQSIETLTGQLGALVRQAKQAETYRRLSEEIREAEALWLYGLWVEAETAARQAEETQAAARRKVGEAEQAAQAARAEAREAESGMNPLREELSIAAALLTRLEGERRAAGEAQARAEAEIASLDERIAQIEKDRAREDSLNTDATSAISQLDEEREQLRADHEGHEDAMKVRDAEVKAKFADLRAQETQSDTLAHEVARLSARHQAVKARYEDAEAAARRARGDAQTAADAVNALAAERKTAEAKRGEAAQADQAAAQALAKIGTALEDAEAARTEADAAQTEAHALRAEREGQLRAIQAELSALEKSLDRQAVSAARILDDVVADKGYETALGAALGEDLMRPEGPEGWQDLGALDAAPLPGESLADHVQAPAALARALAAVGVVEVADAPAMQARLAQGQALVSKAGDLWRWDGFHRPAGQASDSAARLLADRNRRSELTAQRDALARDVEDLETQFSTARDRAQAAREAEKAARQGRNEAEKAANDAARALSLAGSALEALDARDDAAKEAKQRSGETAKAAEEALKAAATEREDLGDLSALREEADQARAALDALRLAAARARDDAEAARREGAAREKRIEEIGWHEKRWRERLGSTGERLADLDARAEKARVARAAAGEKPAEIAAQIEAFDKDLEAARARQEAAQTALKAAEAAQAEALRKVEMAEGALSKAREGRARAEALADAARDKVEAAAQRIREDLSREPKELAGGMDGVELPPSEEVSNRLARLKARRESMGAVNLRAEEDAREVAEERDDLQAQKDDLDQAISKLRQGIANLNREGRARLLSAFDEVNENFARLFSHLFGGGEARLELVESDDPLDAGLEILCQPPGKKLSTLSLLSGGEQTLTALSLIFAVFLANPAPICVLDEVDAPLDDANVTRFCDLLDEMTRQTETRFLIITHHAVTMARMDRLFGVTMAEQGVSQLVSVDLSAAEELVDG